MTLLGSRIIPGSPESDMRSLLILVVAMIFAAAAAAQQNENQQSAQPQAQSANQQKTKKQKQAEPQKAEKAEEPAAKSTEPTPSRNEGKPGDDKKEEHFDMTEIAPVVTHHQVSVNGKTLKYSATTGRLPIKRGDGKIEAEMFFVAYTLDGQEASKRPVTFAFNGGPGSASIWLHMGALGPQRVALNPDGFLPPAPYRTEDTPYT
jgi:carboxypeptidase C (cathepsin A)